MMPADTYSLLTHLWQSTLCVFVAWLLTLALKKNRASVRYWVWLTASVKFLIPFSLLVSLGAEIGWRVLPAHEQTRVFSVVEAMSRPIPSSAPATLPVAAPMVFHPVVAALIAVWVLGFLLTAMYWLMCWLRIRAALRAAVPLPLDLPIRAVSSA